MHETLISIIMLKVLNNLLSDILLPEKVVKKGLKRKTL